MAHPRPARTCRYPTKKAYTRTARRVVKKAFIRGVPAIKISHFDSGNSGKTYKYIVELKVKAPAQIRSQSLEACRIVIGRGLIGMGIENYHFQVRAYPHHVIRENAQISGAGADRLQTGMSHAFGKPASKAARLKKNQSLFTVKCDTQEQVDIARKALRKVYSKIPARIYTEVRELK